MKYFMIPHDKALSNVIAPEKLDSSLYRDKISKKEFDAVQNMVVTYFDNSQELEKPDVLYAPAFLVSDKLKKLLRAFDPGMKCKGIRCYPHEVEDPEALLYWWPWIPRVQCLSEQTTRYPTGLVKHLVVAGNRLQRRPILMIDGTLETIVLVSLELAEAMLRRGLWGMEYIPVDMEEDRR